MAGRFADWLRSIEFTLFERYPEHSQLRRMAGEFTIRDRGRPIPEGLVGEVRRTTAGTRLHIDHRHDEIEFDLVVSGTGSYTVGNLTYELKPGTLVWLATGQQHRLVRSPKLEMWVAHVRPGLFSDLELAEIKAQPSHILPPDELLDLDRLLSQVAQDSDDPKTYNSGISYLMRRALRASESSAPAHIKLMHPAVTRALILLRQSKGAFSLSRLAEESAIAPSYLSRLLVEHTNCSFVDWRNRIRLERFFEDYSPGANLLEASTAAGFGSYARFHHIFSERVGCTPSEWTHRSDHIVPRFGDESAPESLPVRRRWMRLVSFASPALTTLFGADFFDRVLDAAPVARRQDRLQDVDLPMALSAKDAERFVQSVRAENAECADAYDELIQLHDFGGLFAGVVRAYELHPGQLADAATALIVAIWTALSGAADPSFEQVTAARKQIANALWLGPKRNPECDHESHIALLCHFVVVYRALQASRASGSDRTLTQLRAAALSLGRTLFSDSIASARLTEEGFRRSH